MIGWKYFTLFCDDGTIAAGALCANGSDCGLWLSVYGDDSLALDKTYPLDRLSLCAEGMRAGASSLLWSGDVLSLSVREEGVALDVTARRLVDWKDNRIRRAVGARSVSWEVPGLRMSFSGRLSLGGQARDIAGLMFHDEVWHDLTPSAQLLLNFRSWEWGILYSKSYSVLFVRVDYRPNPFRFICINGPQGAVSSSEVGFDGRDLSFQGERLRLDLPVRHAVHHGGRLAKLISRLLRPKRHCCGTFSFRGEEGRAYVESLHFF
ncbi:MAG: hypothetical protein NTY77_08775 [Elusimicrobia bacterium]|nr:hypothetical protein [Elusimicrobiota bacterium]